MKKTEREYIYAHREKLYTGVHRFAWSIEQQQVGFKNPN